MEKKLITSRLLHDVILSHVLIVGTNLAIVFSERMLSNELLL